MVHSREESELLTARRPRTFRTHGLQFLRFAALAGVAIVYGIRNIDNAFPMRRTFQFGSRDGVREMSVNVDDARLGRRRIVLARELFGFIRTRLALYKRVRRLEFSDLRKTTSGRFGRAELRRIEHERTVSERRL